MFVMTYEAVNSDGIVNANQFDNWMGKTGTIFDGTSATCEMRKEM